MQQLRTETGWLIFLSSPFWSPINPFRKMKNRVGKNMEYNAGRRPFPTKFVI